MLKLNTKLVLQKNFLDDRLVWLGNIGLESTYARRQPLDSLPAGFEWNTTRRWSSSRPWPPVFRTASRPTGTSAAELQYQAEFETGVNRERWSLFAGPTLHYGGRKWWATLTGFPQIRGGQARDPKWRAQFTGKRAGARRLLATCEVALK